MGQCRFWRTCKGYDSLAVTCTKIQHRDDGSIYCGIYREKIREINKK